MQAFTDTFSPGVYKDIHALFWEMAVLRDVLAQFVAVFCLGRDDATTPSGLRKSLKKVPSADADAMHFLNLSDKDAAGWMATFGAYHDCLTHSAPLHQVEGVSWAIQDLLTLKDGKTVPQIYYPSAPGRRRSVAPANERGHSSLRSKRWQRILAESVSAPQSRTPWSTCTPVSVNLRTLLHSSSIALRCRLVP